MLYISKEQMARADAKARIRFHKKVRGYVREKLPKTTAHYPDSKLLAYIGKQDKVAVAHGIKSEKGIINWVCLALSYGENFYQKKQTQDFFNMPGTPDVETRLSILTDYLSAKQNNPEVSMASIIAVHGYPRTEA